MVAPVGVVKMKLITFATKSSVLVATFVQVTIKFPHCHVLLVIINLHFWKCEKRINVIQLTFIDWKPFSVIEGGKSTEKKKAIVNIFHSLILYFAQLLEESFFSALLFFFSTLGALKPIGHCCYDICGAVIHIEKPTTYEAPFDLKEVKRIIEITLKPLENVPTTHFEPDFIRKGTSHHFLLINLCNVHFLKIGLFFFSARNITQGQK